MLLLQRVLDALEPATTIDVEHDLVHQGRMWHCSHRLASVANNASLDVLLTVGAQRAHVIKQSQAGGDAWSLFYEAPTVSNAGTSLSIVNMRRATAGAPLLIATHTPTVTSVGTELSGMLMPGGTGSNSPGGAVRFATEWVLNANTRYLLRVTNIASTAQPVSLAVEFYEELA